MTLIRTVAPTAEPVTLVDAKAHLRVTHTSEDGLISGLIRAAREDVERATGMALIDQTWRLVLDRWPADNFVMLMRHPVRQVLSVTIFGSEGAASIVNPADYQLDMLSRPARIHFDRAPERLRVMNGVEIDFRTGFGEAGTDVPDLLKRAVLLLVAHWYDFRTSFGPDDQPVSYPGGYDRLLAGYRMWRL
ncbi:head-tail connector protein [Aminobacter aminovorans]|uniref:head-tail connector protein n=1 Tax=Aminobacter aminovorans TaxID=83263 RepID=UPI00285E839D|nr:head-tail connector protein [Aminobacter aminovorans]MDR7222624.1 putative phiE125 gp8 family phage protein [Aminobacter aminovorans]